MAQNVYDNDVDLVFLYRYTNFVEDEMLINSSRNPAFTGLNTMSVSGAFGSNPELVAGPGASAPKSSGARASGSAGEIFHLPYSPAQSGNASGIDTASDQSFSFGGWMMNQFAGDFKSFISSFAFGTSMRNYEIIARTGSSPDFFWQLRVGSNNGDSTNSISSLVDSFSNHWEHVVGTVDTSTGIDNILLYVSGLLVGSGSVTYSPGTSGAHPGVRLFAGFSSSSEGVGNSVGSSNGGQQAESFFIRRVLSPDEVNGIYQSGFISATSANSDERDIQKDNLGAVGTSAPTLRLTAWNAKDQANPSGMRHTESGSHPAFIKIIGPGSGIEFTRSRFNGVSDPVAISVRNVTSGQLVSGIYVWLQDYDAFAGVTGYEVSARIKSEWDFNLDMASGGGYLARTQASASSILRSDGGETISGVVAQSNVASGEPEVSQYVYLALHTNSNFTPGTFGPSGWNIRISAEFLDV